eukprot:scaffold4589_cov106-Isochrysis_galbana.AAC.6
MTFHPSYPDPDPDSGLRIRRTPTPDLLRNSGIASSASAFAGQEQIARDLSHAGATAVATGCG